ncbi:MAG: hypothetical protein Q9207_003254 [Kuettlingeria erythrocarpa]
MFTSALKSFSSNISANYTISSTPTANCGAWKVYDGKKKSTGRAVSIFVFERKSLDANAGGFGQRSSTSSMKKVHEEVTARVKKESNLLARLRHPSILELAEPIEDTRSGGLMFAAEPVTTSLAGLLHEKDDQEKVSGAASRPSRVVVEDGDGQLRREELEIDELEIQKGLWQVAQGLQFLHESAGLVHGNLTPDSIYINAKSDWKIAGLAFAGPSSTSDTPSNIYPISLSEALYHDPRLPRTLQLDVNYTSPDFVMDNNVSSAADMFSLGLVMLALYNSPHTSPLKTNSNIATYKKLFSSPSSAPSSANNYLLSTPLPNHLLNGVLARLITRRPEQRMTAHEFQQSQLFDNVLVSSIRFLDSLPAKTAHEKSQFMRGYPRILSQFPRPVLEKKILPALLEEMKDQEILFLVLQNVFQIVKLLPSGRRAFEEQVIPKLRDTFPAAKGFLDEQDTAKEAGLVVVLDNMELIGRSCSGKGFKEAILPIVRLGLESRTHSIVDKSLGCLPTIMTLLDFSTIKHEVFPTVAAVFSKTSSLSIKIRGLQAFVIMCGGSSGNTEDFGDGLDGARQPSKTAKPSNNAVLDKYTVQEKIVPLLKAMKTKEPAVMMAALAVFRQVGKVADIEFQATECLPILWGFSLGPLLNLTQFQEYMALIKSLSSRIEHEQMRKLRQLSSGSNATRSNDLMNMGSTDVIFGQDVGHNDFERLVLDRSTSKRSFDMPRDSFGSQPQGADSSRATAPAFSWPTPNIASTHKYGDGASTVNSFCHPTNLNFQNPGTRTSLNNIAPLKPMPPPNAGHGNAMANGSGPVNALQPSILQSSPWSTSLSAPVAQATLRPSYGQTQPHYSLAPPPKSTAPYVRYSIAPPSTQKQSSIPAVQANGVIQPNQNKTGLDAYESLL